jgi:hypothetical protein
MEYFLGGFGIGFLAGTIFGINMGVLAIKHALNRWRGETE